MTGTVRPAFRNRSDLRVDSPIHFRTGGISERARKRAEELARDADLRVRPPRKGAGAAEPIAPPRDPRLPPAGGELKRLYKGKEHVVRVLEDSFEYDGKLFSSLSAVARTISGTRWNGFLFFNLGETAKVGR